MDVQPTPQVYRRFESRHDFQEAVRAAFEFAAEQGSRELWLCDTDYADWPLGERAVVEALTRWAYGHRRLVVLASSFDEIVRRHARWVQWRREWAHIVECRSIEQLPPQQVPRLWLAPGQHLVRLLDPLHYRGVVENHGVDLVAAHEALNEMLQLSVDTFPAHTLGL
jgi:peptidyl-tRNA hydrolase